MGIFSCRQIAIQGKDNDCEFLPHWDNHVAGSEASVSSVQDNLGEGGRTGTHRVVEGGKTGTHREGEGDRTG